MREKLFLKREDEREDSETVREMAVSGLHRSVSSWRFVTSRVEMPLSTEKAEHDVCERLPPPLHLSF